MSKLGGVVVRASCLGKVSVVVRASGKVGVVVHASCLDKVGVVVRASCLS